MFDRDQCYFCWDDAVRRSLSSLSTTQTLVKIAVIKVDCFHGSASPDKQQNLPKARSESSLLHVSKLCSMSVNNRVIAEIMSKLFFDDDQPIKPGG